MTFYISDRRLSKYTSMLNHMSSSLSHTSRILHFVVYIIFSLIETKVSFQQTGSAEFSPRSPPRCNAIPMYAGKFREAMRRARGGQVGLSDGSADHLNQHQGALSRVWTIYARSTVTGYRVPRTATAVPLSSAAMEQRRRRRWHTPSIGETRRRRHLASCVSQSAANALRRAEDADNSVSLWLGRRK